MPVKSLFAGEYLMVTYVHVHLITADLRGKKPRGARRHEVLRLLADPSSHDRDLDVAGFEQLEDTFGVDCSDLV